MNTIIMFIILTILFASIFCILYSIYKMENSLKTIIDHNKAVLDNLMNVLNICKDVTIDNRECKETSNKLYDLCVKLYKDILKNITFIKANMIRRKHPMED